MPRKEKRVTRVGTLPVIYLPATLAHLVGKTYELEVYEDHLVIRFTDIRDAQEDLRGRIMSRITALEQNLRRLKRELEVMLNAPRGQQK